MSTTTTTHAKVVRRSFHTGDDIIYAIDNITAGAEGCAITVKMTDWYGDPLVRDVELSMTYMKMPVVFEESHGWKAVGDEHTIN